MKKSRLLPAAGLLVFLAALLFAPDIVARSAREGLSLCARVLVPSLFPFFVCARLIVRLDAAAPIARLLSPLMGRLFGVSGQASTALVLGLVGGYPTGAQMVKNLYEQQKISKDEARRLVLFCNNAGPAFIFGVVGSGLFRSPPLGAMLFLIHALSAVLTGVFLRRPCPKPRNDRTQALPSAGDSFSGVFVSCVQSAGTAVLNVCMFVTLFSVFSGLLQALTVSFLPPAIFALLSGMLELSGGVAALGTCQMPLSLTLAAASFLLAFSGLSVMAQTASILSSDGLFPPAYVLARLLQGLIAAALTLFAATLLGLDRSAIPAASISGYGILPLLLFLWLLGGMICLLCRKMCYGNRRRDRV